LTIIETDYENPWTFNNKPFTSEDIQKYVGFVYVIIQQDSGRRYIGRKYFHTLRKEKGKAKRVRRESDWKKYYGSSGDVKADVKALGKDKFQRIILSLHTTRGDCNYEEVKQQFKNDVLEDTIYYNDNINGKWYRKSDHIVEGRIYNEDFRL
jgi:hypothetical protein